MNYLYLFGVLAVLAQLSLVDSWQLCVKNVGQQQTAIIARDCTSNIESGQFDRYYNNSILLCPYSHCILIQCPNVNCDLNFGCRMACDLIVNGHQPGTCVATGQPYNVTWFFQPDSEFFQYLYASPLMLEGNDAVEWKEGQPLALDLIPGQMATINTGTSCSSHQKRQTGVEVVVLIIGVSWIINFATGGFILEKAKNVLQQGVDALKELTSELQTDQNQATVSMQLERDCALINAAKRSVNTEAGNLQVSVLHALNNITLSFRLGPQLIALYSISGNDSAIASFRSTMELDITTNAQSPAANPTTPPNAAAPLINSASSLYHYAKLLYLCFLIFMD